MSRLGLNATAIACVVLAIAVPSAAARGAIANDPFVRGFVVSDGTVYAATYTAVFRSGDGGDSWQPADDGLADSQIYELAVHRGEPSVLYAATAKGVFKSTDAGGSWRPTALREPVWTISIASADTRTVYAAANGRVFKTSNTGVSWGTVLTDELERFFALATNPRDASTVYAGGSSGVFKTSNGGLQWDSLSRGLFAAVTADEVKHRFLEGFVFALAVDPRHSQTLYLGSDRGVFKTVDGGYHWRSLKPGLIGRDSRYKLVTALAIDPTDSRVVYAGAGFGSRTGNGLFKTTNAGRSWRFRALPDHGYVSALALDPQDSKTIYAATSIEGGGHAFKSTDAGRTWHALTLPSL
jgi:photosystem II stability/assembly factor-like uncharacterized protein